MKKKGFTLAEVLVVLGVIGVVSALTLPSLMSNTASAQVGPKLAKAVAMFDQANGALLNAASADHLIDTGYLDNNKYTSELVNYLKATTNGSVSTTATPSGCSGLSGEWIGAVTAKDGVIYEMFYNTNASVSGKAAHNDKIGYVLVDINGTADPGEPGEDIFAFSWWGDGSIRPAGATGSDSGCSWDTACKEPDANGNKFTPTNPWACAGHVFANNLKVLYE